MIHHSVQCKKKAKRKAKRGPFEGLEEYHHAGGVGAERRSSASDASAAAAAGHASAADAVVDVVAHVAPAAAAAHDARAVVRCGGEGEQDAGLRGALPDHLAVERQQARPLRPHPTQRGKNETLSGGDHG